MIEQYERIKEDSILELPCDQEFRINNQSIYCKTKGGHCKKWCCMTYQDMLDKVLEV